MRILLLSLTLILLAQCQRPEIRLDTVYNLDLPANQVEKFELNIPEDYPGNQNLYISAYSIINDPFEEPIMQIVSEDYSMKCDSEETDLNDLCFVPFEKVSPGTKVNIDLHCEADCKAKLVAYLAETVELDLGDFVEVESGSSPLEKNLRIFVP